MATDSCGDEHGRNLGGGFVPRHAESYGAAGVLGADQATVYLNKNARAFRVGVAGNVKVTDESGADVILYNVQVGETVVMAFSAIKSSGSTAYQFTVFWA